MKKQTAVEWYEKEIMSLIRKYENKEISKWEYIIMRHNLFYPAKTMEKEQIIEAYMKAKLEHIDTLGLNAMKNKIIKASEEYYNETYGGDE